MEPGHQLDVAGPGELVEWRDLGEREAAIDQDPRVAGEGVRVAGDGDGGRQHGLGDALGLLARAGARRVEDRAIETGEFGRFDRLARQVAGLDADATGQVRAPRGRP